ncbi:hypothetical protein QP028_05090 [Corynebacterium suedekumii]|nr:hypothetical protein QP028_05090 [Corynebacterium suedekumii]
MSERVSSAGMSSLITFHFGVDDADIRGIDTDVGSGDGGIVRGFELGRDDLRGTLLAPLVDDPFLALVLNVFQGSAREHLGQIQRGGGVRQDRPRHPQDPRHEFFVDSAGR